MRSIRGHLNLRLLVGSGLLMLVAGIVLERRISGRMEREFDTALQAKARALVTLTKQEGDVVEIDFADEFMPEFEAKERPEYFQIWLDDGDVVERSRSLRKTDLARETPLAARPMFRDVALLDGRPGRQVQIDFVPQREDTDEEPHLSDEGMDVALDPTRLPPGSGRHAVTIVVARGREGLATALHFVRLSLGGIAIALLASTAIMVPLSTRAGLRPLEEIGRQVEELGAGRLDRRVALRRAPAELVPLVDKLNDLLGRLEEAFDRERRLSSDVAHELRTPVAELRNLTEVGRRWPEGREAVLRFFEDAHDIALQMEEIITNLLSLARCDGGIEGVDLEEVELSSAIARSWSRVEARARARGVTLVLEVPPGASAVTDRLKLELMLRNLLGNAADYCPSGATVRCRVHDEGERRIVEIGNPAPHLSPAEVPLMFDRFWRKDPSRTGGQHAGLGLPLVRAFADLLRIELRPSLDAQGVLAIRLGLERGGTAGVEAPPEPHAEAAGLGAAALSPP